MILKRLSDYLRRSPVSRILLGSLLGQGTLLAVSPVLTRLYTPSDFSAFALVTAVSAVLGGVVTLSWERAIVVPQDEAKAKALVLLGLASTLFLSAAVAVVALVARSDIAELLGSQVFVDFWWVTPLTIMSIGLYAVLSSWVVRQRQYGRIGARNATQGLSQATSSVVLGMVAAGPIGLLTSLAVGRLTAMIGLAGRASGLSTNRIDTARVRGVAVEFRRFPLINTWSRLANSAGLQLPVIALIALYTSLETGLYALTIRVLASPVGIIVDATSQYFEGTFARLHREEPGGRAALVRTFVQRMLLIGVAPTVLVILLAPPLFGWIFGSQWEQSGSFARLIVFTYLAQFVVTPVSRSLVILGWQFTQLAWDVGRCIAILAAIALCAYKSVSFESCLVIVTVVQVAAYGLMLGLCSRAARIADRRPLLDARSGG